MSQTATLGICDICGKQEAVIQGELTNYCQACNDREVLRQAAIEDLKDEMTPILKAWKAKYEAKNMGIGDTDNAFYWQTGSEVAEEILKNN